MIPFMHEKLRMALASYLGKTITPDVAVLIETYVMGATDFSYAPSLFGSRKYKKMTFQCERFADIVGDLEKCHRQHYCETELYRRGLPLDPKYDQICDLERMGQAVQFTARTESGDLAGNILMYINTSLHTDSLIANEDTLYIKPEYRKGFMAVRFMQFVEDSLQLIGVKEIFTDSKTVNSAHRLVEYLGYKHVANRYAKVFGE
ncbi:hypothetical protein UFOVP1304_24 [uncultured Caudovirales phage]|uniref:N-acetyltransferase domain-containing protein n=1 Tax=uncultured Caudovirales phage TaxID=2100421 RepID=A0A6J5RI36_9CAUD|nr:hypothetical protein UFOVP1304_24 [uncultured Caudovirales phage]